MDGEILEGDFESSPPSTLPALRQPGADMRGQLQMLDPESQNRVLTEYRESRTNLRKWIKDQLKEGIHYGFPPGLMPQTKRIEGVLHYQVRTKSGTQWISEKQWTMKPCLYKAGADMLIELFNVHDKYEANKAVWEMMGSRPNEVCMTCLLIDKATGDVIGEGTGFGSRGTKDDWEGKNGNTAIKMAKKRAKVDAAINAFGLSDLFTQDEDSQTDAESQPEVQNPQQSSEAPPEVATRASGTQSPGPAKIGQPSQEDFNALKRRWVNVANTENKQMGQPPMTNEDMRSNFLTWASRCTGEPQSDGLADVSNWTRQMLTKANKDLASAEASLGL